MRVRGERRVVLRYTHLDPPTHSGEDKQDSSLETQRRSFHWIPPRTSRAHALVFFWTNSRCSHVPHRPRHVLTHRPPVDSNECRKVREDQQLALARSGSSECRLQPARIKSLSPASIGGNAIRRERADFGLPIGARSVDSAVNGFCVRTL